MKKNQEKYGWKKSAEDQFLDDVRPLTLQEKVNLGMRNPIDLLLTKNNEDDDYNDEKDYEDFEDFEEEEPIFYDDDDGYNFTPSAL